jgi:xanthine dehydrogenase accessory factor
MNENEYLAGTVSQHLSDGSPVVLVSIIRMHGSTPRHNGTKMVVGADGKSYGTIGGSLIEAAAIRESGDLLTAKKSKLFFFELSGKDASDAGMICGGRAELLLDYIPATEENREFSRRWYEETKGGGDFSLVTQLKDSGDNVEVLGRLIINSDGQITGSTSLTEAGINTVKAELRKNSSTTVITIENTRVMIDPICRQKTLYCFGAGHVAVPTAHVAALAGFRVIVIDDRADFASPERFPDAAGVYVIDDFNRALEGLEIDEDSFIVIVTRGHQYDRVVLEQSLKTGAGYIGMISSRRKREAIYEALVAAGEKKERLEQVHSPIGINIGGETPEEIAVSIVAELIQVRSGLQL